MFETSVVRAEARAATGRFSLLTISVIAHTSIVLGAIIVSIATIDFPAFAPKEYARAPVFAAVQIPPPLGNPNGGARPQTAQPQPPVRPPVNTQVTAPPNVPDDVPVLDASTTGVGDSNSNTPGTVEGPIGVPWGKEGSLGDLNSPPVVDAPPVQPQVEERIYEPGEVVAPVLIRKVDPRYPVQLQKVGMAATVVIRCVIDKNGQVRDPQVVVPAMAPFNAEVLNVITQWRYKPATHAGHAVDSYLNLTVHFSVRR